MENTQQLSNKQILGQENKSIKMKLLQVFLMLNAIIWFFYGIIAFFGGTTNPDLVLLMKLLSFAMFGDAGLFVLVFVGTIKKKSWVYIVGLILSIVNILLSVTDEFGTADFIAIFLSLATLILIILNKSIFDLYKK